MIEFQYFISCPHAKTTLNNLRDVLAELRISTDDLRIIEVPDAENAQKIKFQGSPTILVNGEDIYTGLKPDGYSYSCRVYNFKGLHTGVIPKEFIKAKLEMMLLNNDFLGDNVSGPGNT